MEEKREKNYRLINMEDVQAREVNWLWYPYIPYGKLTIVQGDPGEGKTTFILHLAALLTKGEPLPNEEVEVQREPVNLSKCRGQLGRYHKTTIIRSQSRL